MIEREKNKGNARAKVQKMGPFPEAMTFWAHKLLFPCRI